MFYSHQLLARKAALGQIWMAATMDIKINRRKLDKLDIPRICEEIMNPPVPMALRLSGILMGGVANVFKQKIDLLYGDANRIMDTLNKSFKASIADGDKIQSKGMVQTRSMTSSKMEEKGCTEVDQKQHSTRYLHRLVDAGTFRDMSLENLDDQYLAKHVGDDDPRHHQVDPANITLPDEVDLGALHTGPFDRFERFDTGDEHISSLDDLNSSVLPDVPPRVPLFSPQPPHVSDQDDPMMSKEMKGDEQPPQAVQHEAQTRPEEEPDLRRSFKRKAREKSSRIIIDLQTKISDETYRLWQLNDASYINSLRRRKRNMSFTRLELWRKKTFRNLQNPVVQPNRTSHPFPKEAQHQEFANIQQGYFGIDKTIVAKEEHNLALKGVLRGFTSSRSHGETSQPIHNSKPLTFGRSNKRHACLPIRILDTIAEDEIMPDLGALEETGPTQTRYGPAVEPVFDRVAESFRKQLKSHFDTRGNSQAESLNNLADGLTRNRAALLFYHTCVMASDDYVKVEQLVPYGDISISRGPRM